MPDETTPAADDAELIDDEGQAASDAVDEALAILPSPFDQKPAVEPPSGSVDSSARLPEVFVPAKPFDAPTDKYEPFHWGERDTTGEKRPEDHVRAKYEPLRW
ncbi:hypothetical protein I5G71_gp86 [Mycobacterium phage Patt]|uniref:Uncharacterized protein n=2 Tax=Fionnbharthvirus TaxID=2948708 RepID=A0A481VRF7_9CAUD|nr:hypothetical protein I5G70_gp40 [Mycobacterium phage Taquito]YP_009950617.1 hypothetical protein I5G71_gp86 [Mycobacterium phage Patt]AOT23213.1 hypothetical protein SEA_TAQUITO_93 [Mycobacterium phage Taquito]QBI96318.1 hypothetical protein SEA_PATT_86 [Mycobacterium phage Patt]